MVAFTDEQLVIIQTIASPLPLKLRNAFLEVLAAELCSQEPADDECLYNAALKARQVVSRAS